MFGSWVTDLRAAHRAELSKGTEAPELLAVGCRAGRAADPIRRGVALSRPHIAIAFAESPSTAQTAPHFGSSNSAMTLTRRHDRAN
mmetsp:Transcript_39200/g.92294  ORF Transcript_39200/g.92294 Transcript_39200/m.92294 type:complete len:86 (+) Transcript_39200:709-966(+)